MGGDRGLITVIATGAALVGEDRRQYQPLYHCRHYIAGRGAAEGSPETGEQLKLRRDGGRRARGQDAVLWAVTPVRDVGSVDVEDGAVAESWGTQTWSTYSTCSSAG